MLNFNVTCVFFTFFNFCVNTLRGVTDGGGMLIC